MKTMQNTIDIASLDTSTLQKALGIREQIDELTAELDGIMEGKTYLNSPRRAKSASAVSVSKAPHKARAEGAGRTPHFKNAVVKVLGHMTDKQNKEGFSPADIAERVTKELGHDVDAKRISGFIWANGPLFKVLSRGRYTAA